MTGSIARIGTDLALFNALDEGVVAVDAAMTIVFVNPATERMFGYRAADLLGTPLDRLIPVESRGQHRQQVERFRDSQASSRMMGARSAVRGLRADGTVFEAEASISRSTLTGTILLMAIIRDVSARREAEARLRASEQKHRAILETCGDAVLIADADSGLILEVNASAGRLFGCEPAELIGAHHSNLHPEADRERLRRAFREPLDSGRAVAQSTTIQRRDGDVVPVEIAARPVTIDGALRIVGFFRDVSHRVEHERRLIQAREAALAADRSKTTFLANVSHELRTPLNAIIGLSQMIAEGMFGTVGHPKYAEYARDIRDSGHHLLDVIDDILDLSRVELDKIALKEEWLDLSAVIDQCERTVVTLAESSGLLCQTRVEPGADRLRADPRAVRQMLLNLLSNAIRHTTQGGRIEIAAETVADGGLVLPSTP